MFHYFIRYVQVCLLVGCLTGAWGCARVMDAMPERPGVPARVELYGPYDAEIPVREANQIKSLGLMNDWGVPYIFMQVGTHFEAAGDSIRCIHFFNRAREEFRKRHNALGEASAESRKISALIHFGNRRAASLVIEALDRKWSRAPFNAFVFFNYGYYHLKNGNYAKARKYFEQALQANAPAADQPDLLALRRDTELGYSMTLILADYFSSVAGRLGLADFDAAFYRNIRRHASDGLAGLDRVSVLNKRLSRTKVHLYFPEIVPSAIECDVFNYRGLALGLAGRTADAVQSLERAMGLARNTKYHLGEADSAFFLSQVYLLDKNPAEGVKAIDALANIAERYQMVSYAIWAQMMLAHHHKTAGDVDRTMISMDRALALMEENSSWLMPNRDFRGIGHFNRQEIYEALLELAAGKGDERRAFQTAERSKAAVLADRLSGDAMGKTADMSENIKQILFYREQLSEYYERLLSSSNGDATFRDLVAGIDRGRSAYQQLNRRVEAKDGALYSLIGVVPPTVDDLQRILDNNTTLFTYYVGREHLYIWAVSRSGFRQEKTGLSRGAVEQLVSAYLSALGSKDRSHADVRAEQIYETFLKPVIPFVSGDRVGFVPHGVLCNIPFAAMRYVKSYLVDGFTVFYLPHAGLVQRQPAHKPGKNEKTAIIIADAPCVEKKQSSVCAEGEVNAVKKIFLRAESIVKDDALRDDWRMYAGTYDAIHLIVDHCLMGDAPFDYSPSLQAARWRDGCPSMRDIFRLGLHGNATLLSVCREEKMPAIQGAGRPSWTGAWLYAVSPQIVTQLWDIEHRTKTVLMGMFYSHFKKNGDAAEALREAQNGMIQLRYGPSDWAAFIVTGQAASKELRIFGPTAPAFPARRGQVLSFGHGSVGVASVQSIFLA